jgi:hypothetical protein
MFTEEKHTSTCSLAVVLGSGRVAGCSVPPRGAPARCACQPVRYLDTTTSERPDRRALGFAEGRSATVAGYTIAHRTFRLFSLGDHECTILLFSSTVSLLQRNGGTGRAVSP